MRRDPVRVLVAAEQQRVRSELAACIAGLQDLVLVGEARNGAETLEACTGELPDVVLLDMSISDTECAGLTRAIRQRYPGVRVFVLTTWDEHDAVMCALAGGAERYLVKGLAGEELADTIRLACRAPVPITGLPEARSDLTERELEVLQWVALGLTNPQIGSKLVVSRATVKFHVSSILRKLGAASRTEAAVLGMQNHLIPGYTNHNGTGLQK